MTKTRSPIQRSRRGWPSVLVLLLASMLLAAEMSAKTIAVATSGGDNNGAFNEWRRDNIDNACAKFETLGADECNRAFDKAALRRQIATAVEQLACGDSLILYFNGHGDENKGFVFDREGHRSPDRFVTPEEILNWLEDLDCCVKIYVAWHACYSGAFARKLLEDPHVVVAVSSAAPDKTAHKKGGYNTLTGGFVNWRNWPDGFVDGLRPGDSLAAIFQRAAREGKRNAEETSAARQGPTKTSRRTSNAATSRASSPCQVRGCCE